MAESLKDKTAKGFLWGFLNNSTMQILNAVFGIILARKLSQDDYGLIGMMTIFTAIAASLQDSGFVSALTNKKDASHTDYNAVFWFNIGVSACLYVLFFFSAPLLADFYDEPLLTSLFRYYSLGFFAASFSIVPRAILFKQIKQKELAVITIIALLVSGIIGVTMAFMGMAYWGLATQSICYTSLVSVVSWLISGFRPSLNITFKPIMEMFGFSSKMLLTSIFTQINNNIFSVVLGKFYTKSEVGLYNQANKWNNMGSSTINGMVSGVAQPAFVQVGNDPERLRRVLSKMLRFTCFVSFPAMFGLALVAPEFIVILITDKWLPSAELMRILCIGGAFVPLATLLSNIVISHGKSNIFMWSTIAQGLTVLVSILLIYHYGGSIRMMVYANVIIIILWIAIWNYFVWREIHFSLWQTLRDIMPFLLIAAVTMTATYFITQPITNLHTNIDFFTLKITNLHILLVSRIIIAALLYCIISWLCGAKIMRECLGYIIKKKF